MTLTMPPLWPSTLCNFAILEKKVRSGLWTMIHATPSLHRTSAGVGQPCSIHRGRGLLLKCTNSTGMTSKRASRGCGLVVNTKRGTETVRGRLDHRGPSYAYLDPASGRKQAKRPGARSALIVACIAPPAFVHVRYAWAARASTTEITEQLFLIHSLYSPVQMAIETAGQQYLLYSHLVDEALRR